MKITFAIFIAGLVGVSLSACHAPYRTGSSIDGDYGKLTLQSPPIVQQPVRATDIARLMEAHGKPAARYLIKVEVVRKGHGPALVKTVELKPGQAGRIGQTREFPYPTEYLLPRVATTKEEKAFGPVIPITPTSFETKDLGWWCDLKLIPRGPVMELRGEYTEQMCQGFALNPGEVSSPLIDDRKTVLTDNKALAPRFTRHSSPLAVFATPGKTYRVDVNSSARRAWLNISCVPVDPSIDTRDYTILRSVPPGTVTKRVLQFGNEPKAKPLLSSLP